MKKQIFRTLSAVLAVSFLLCLAACGNTSSANSSAADHDSIEISIVYPNGESALEGEDPSWRAFRETIDEWEAMHPEVNLVRITDINYVKSPSAFALNDALPDLFLVSGNSYNWIQYGLLLDITDEVAGIPATENVETEYYKEFTKEDRVYAFPALSAVGSVIVYDKTAWENAGYSAFPDDWAGLKAVAEKLQGSNYKEAIAFGNSGGSAFFSLIFNRILLDVVEEDWLDNLTAANKQSSFYDPDIMQALEDTAEIAESDIFGEDYNNMTANEAKNAFLNGEALALLCSTTTVAQVLLKLQEEDPERYAQLGFAAVPGMEDNSTYCSVRGMNAGLALNPHLAENEEKLAICYDLAEYVTGSAYAKKLAEETGLGSLYTIDGIPDDSVKDALYTTVYLNAEGQPLLTHYLESSCWSSFYSKISSMLKGENITAEECCKAAQDSYESGYYADYTGQISVFDHYEDEVDAVMAALQTKNGK